MSIAEQVAKDRYESSRRRQDPPWPVLSVVDWDRKDAMVRTATEQLDRGLITAPR